MRLRQVLQELQSGGARIGLVLRREIEQQIQRIAREPHGNTRSDMFEGYLRFLERKGMIARGNI